MKGMKHLLFAASCAVLAACTQTDGIDRLPVAIGFTPTVDNAQTRGEDLTTATLGSFGVFAYFTQGGDFNPSTSVPNFMHNKEVSKNSGSWTYSPTMYWPVNSNDKLSFFAYAPSQNDIAAEGNAIEVPGNAQVGYPVFTYTNTNAQTDLLTAVPAMNMDNSSPGVSFTFKHSMAKIIFKVKSCYDLTVTRLSIRGKGAGKLTFDDSGVTWSGFSNEKDYSYTGSASITANSEAAEIITLFMLPEYTGTFSIGYTLDGNAITKNNLSLPAGTWVQGESTVYSISIDKIGLSINAGNVPWTDGGEKNLHETEMSFSPDDTPWTDGGDKLMHETEMDASSGDVPWTEEDSKNINCTTT